jgi:hypothetical protein
MEPVCVPKPYGSKPKNAAASLPPNSIADLKDRSFFASPACSISYPANPRPLLTRVERH